MIELTNDQLTFSFSETHPDARLNVEFQRTLRIPHSETEMPRLPSLGPYPLYGVEEHLHRVPQHWHQTGGAMLPMYQSEAMWLSFRPTYSVAHQTFYPFAVKIRIGGLDAVRGNRWLEGLHQWPQDFLVINEHSWLGGYQTGSDGICQFVAMPLGSGYLPDSNGNGNGPNGYGHIEIVAYPMSASSFEMRYPRNGWQERLTEVPIGIPARLAGNRERDHGPDILERQRIEDGLFPVQDWDGIAAERYNLHLVNSLHWCAITGGPPPMAPSRVRLAREQTRLAVPKAIDPTTLLGSSQWKTD